MLNVLTRARKWATILCVPVALAASATVANAATVTMTIPELGLFSPDASGTTAGVVSSNTSIPVGSPSGENFDADFDLVTPGPAMALWTAGDAGAGSLGIAFVAGDTFALKLKNQNGSPWNFSLFINGSLVDTLPLLPVNATGIFSVDFAAVGGDIDFVSIKVDQTVPIAPDFDTTADFRVTPVPVPAAALAGLPMLGILGLIQLKRRR